MKTSKEILVLVEHRRNEIRDITYELLTLAKDVAVKANCQVNAIVFGDKINGLTEKLIPWAETVYMIDDAKFTNFNAELYQLALSQILKERAPALTLIGHSAFGVDIAPSLATTLKIPLATDCTGIDYDGSSLKVTRTVYGGKLNCQTNVKLNDSYIVTIRAAAITPTRGSFSGKVEKLTAPTIEDIKYRRFLEYLEAAVGEVDITKSDIVIGIGRGIKEAKNLPIIEELAKALGGVVACSRPVVDGGWLPKERQVGSSGKTIKPKLYIAIGISGSFQHIAGMRGAQTIVAINKDPNAPIFSEAHYGIVDDLFKVVPVLKEKIINLKKG